MEYSTKETQTKHLYKAGDFEGPLDLLWTLIHDNQVDIYDIPIAQITLQFLDYIDSIKAVALQDLSEFYYWAAKLICIKAKLLLPVNVEINDDYDIEDPRESLVETLIEYHKFKKLGILLEVEAEQAEFVYDYKHNERLIPYKEDSVWKEINADSLLEKMQDVYKKLVQTYQEPLLLEINQDTCVNEKITLMTEYFIRVGECMFTDLITKKNNLLDIVCAFMAVLEAVKSKMALIYQNIIFGDIKICQRPPSE